MTHSRDGLAARIEALRSFSLLVVDDEAETRDQYRAVVERRIPHSRVVAAESLDGAEDALGRAHADVVLLDLHMEGRRRHEVIAEAHRRHPDAPCVLVADYDEVDAALGAVQRGDVQRFLLKPVDADRLVDLLQDLRCRGR